MGRDSSLVIAALVCALAAACARPSAEGSLDTLLMPLAGESESKSPADRQLRAARAIVQSRASDPKGYNLLAAAYMQ